MRKKIRLLPIILLLPILGIISSKFFENSVIQNEIQYISYYNENNVEENIENNSEEDITNPVTCDNCSSSESEIIAEKSDYEYQQVRMFAISLKVKGDYDENKKSTPLTCKINIDRMTRVIYMDGDEELGYKFVYYKKPVGELMNPTKKGYTFVEWTNKDGEVVDDKTVINTNADYRIYANWNIVVSELSVNPNGGTWEKSVGIQTFNMEYQEEKEITDPTRAGYGFVNWIYKGQDSTLENRIFKMGTENASLIALWNPNDYTLNIDANGGKYDGQEGITSFTIKYDSTTDILEPTRIGYTFTGWTVSNGELNGNKFFMNYLGDVTLTANWVINDYDYSVFHSQQSVDGSAYNRVAADTITGKAPYLTVLTPEVNTYTGFTSPSQQEMTIQVDTTPPEINIVEYKYSRNGYTLTINPNTGSWNGKTTSSTVDLKYEQTYTVENPTKVGYNFTNWTKSSTDSTLTDKVFKMGVTNTTLTANWSAKQYTLTYDVNGGNTLSPTSKTITYDSAYGSLPTPTRSGYAFVGWYTAKTGGTKVDSSTVHRVENNVTIYAHWSNTAPTTPQFNLLYTNTGASDQGMIKNGSETITVTVTSRDAEEGTPNIDLICISGKLCNNITIRRTGVATNGYVYTITASKIGVAVLRAVATDIPGLSASNSEILYVATEGGKISDEEKFSKYDYDSGWFEELEGCYISDFSFTVKFSSGHNNSSNNDYMVATGLTQSGQEVQLYYWKGNMLGNLIASDTINLNNYNRTDKIVKIKFYAYSPHDGCTPAAKITYSITYSFDRSLIDY